MSSVFNLLVSASGIILLLTLIASAMDKDGKWTGFIRSVSQFSAKVSAIFLAFLVMANASALNLRVMSFETIGIYVACLAIIWFSGKELIGKSKLVTDLSVIATDQAGKIQTRISEKANQVNQDNSKIEPESK